MSKEVIEILSILISWPGAMILVALCFTFLYLLFSEFRSFIARIHKIDKNGVVIMPLNTNDINQPDISTPEIKPKLTSTEGAELDTEEDIWLKMYQGALEGKSLKEIEQTYIKLKNLPNRQRTDEEIERDWFIIKLSLDKNVEKELKELVKSRPNSFFPYELLVEYYIRLQSIQSAEEFFNKAFERALTDDQKRQCHLMKAKILEQSQGEKEALKYLESTGSNSEWLAQRDQWLSTIANYQEKLDDKTNQQITLENLLEHNPTDFELRFKLACSYAENRQTYLLAINHYEILLNQEPRNASVLNNLAILYEKLDYISEYNKCINLAIQNGGIHAKGNYIISLLEKGFIVEASKVLEALTEEEAKNERIADAIRHFYRLKQIEIDKKNKLSKLITLQKQYITLGIKDYPIDTINLVGTWQSDDRQLIINLASNKIISGEYLVENISLVNFLPGNSQGLKKYNVYGNYNGSIVEITCFIGTLLGGDTLSFWLVLKEEKKLEGFIWCGSDMPKPVTFTRS